jgi:predicted nucleotidyltransferase
MLTLGDIRARRQEIARIGARYGARDFRVFGSVARGEATDASDVDLLVKFEEGRSLLDQGGLLMDLRELLRTKVDILSEGALAGRFGDRVRDEAVPL